MSWWCQFNMVIECDSWILISSALKWKSVARLRWWSGCNIIRIRHFSHNRQTFFTQRSIKSLSSEACCLHLIRFARAECGDHDFPLWSRDSALRSCPSTVSESKETALIWEHSLNPLDCIQMKRWSIFKNKSHILQFSFSYQSVWDGYATPGEFGLWKQALLTFLKCGVCVVVQAKRSCVALIQWPTLAFYCHHLHVFWDSFKLTAYKKDTKLWRIIHTQMDSHPRWSWKIPLAFASLEHSPRCA